MFVVLAILYQMHKDWYGDVNSTNHEMANRWKKLVPKSWSTVIGMIHVQPLPGSPRSSLSMSEIVARACKEAELYRRCGVHGVIVENMHDVPYLRSDKVGPEVTGCMARVASEVRRVTKDMILGVQILSSANKEAVAVAKASGAEFIRAEGFVFSHVGDEGWVDSCAGELLRYRRAINAEDIAIWTDIKKKHCSHAVTADLGISDLTKAAEFFCSDGIIVTGSETGSPADGEDVTEAREATQLPLVIGSGVTEANMKEYHGKADVLIVGSHFKVGGRWHDDVDEDRVRNFMTKHKQV